MSGQSVDRCSDPALEPWESKPGGVTGQSTRGETDARRPGRRARSRRVPCRGAHGRTHAPRARRRSARRPGTRRLYRAGTPRHGGRRPQDTGRWTESGCGYPVVPRRPAPDRLRRGRPLRPGRSEGERRLPARHGPAPEVPADPVLVPDRPRAHDRPPACGRAQTRSRVPAGSRAPVRSRVCADGPQEQPPARRAGAPVPTHVSTRRPKPQTQCRARSGAADCWDVRVAETGTGRSPAEAHERCERHLPARGRHLRRSDPA